MKVQEIDIDREIGEVGKILGNQDKKRGILIHALHKIQEDNGYLSGEALQRLSKTLDISLSEIYSVASFYKMFHFKPRGKKIVKVCLGTACYVRGARKLLTAVEGTFNVKSGETTEDLALTLETVGCVGCCGLAPVATVNDEVLGDIIGEKKIGRFIQAIRHDGTL